MRSFFLTLGSCGRMWIRWLARTGLLLCGVACSRPPPTPLSPSLPNSPPPQAPASVAITDTPHFPAHNATEPPAAHQDELAHAGLPTKIRLTPEVERAAGIRVVAVHRALLPGTIDVSGEVVPDPDGMAAVSARVPGRIAAVRFKVGQWVKAGELLAVIESAELARARGSYTATHARSVAKRQQADRAAVLAEKGILPLEEAQLVQAESTALAADTKAARATLAAFGDDALRVSADPSRLELHVPIDGFVLKRDATLGQPVTAERVIAEIARFDHAYFLARLFEKDLAYVTQGSAADVVLNAYPGVAWSGMVESIGKHIDQSARTVIARIRIADRDGMLKAGLFGMARIVIQAPAADTDAEDHAPWQAASQLVIPQSAVTEIASHTVVFVQQPDGDYEVHPVTLGRKAAGQVVVINGLRADEKVVSSGVFTLKSSVLKNTFGE